MTKKEKIKQQFKANFELPSRYDAVDIAMVALANWHGRFTEDGNEPVEHERECEDCHCQMGKSYRDLIRLRSILR